MSTELMGKDCSGWAARDPSGILSPYAFKRRVLGSDDVLIKITHCGVCYGDIVTIQNKLGPAHYPLVPGHEMVGVVVEIGSDVQKFKIGDRAGVGTIVNSCRNCEECKEGIEVHCSNGAIHTYNSVDVDGSITQGGYSSLIVTHQSYTFHIAEDYPMHLAAPLLCAGITVYSPMIHHKMNQAGKSLGVIGLGGLGHMAVKFGKAFGLSVTVFSTSPSKEDEALNLLGADKFVVSTDEEQMKGLAKSLDFIIDTASGDHLFDPYMATLKTKGNFVIVGFPSEVRVHPISLLRGMRSITGSATGGLKDTQDMLNFCAANKIYPNVELIKIDYINEAYKRMAKNDVKYRFVIDIENSFK